MKNKTPEKLLAQSDYWDQARTVEREWVEITDVEPILIPADLRRRLERVSARQGMTADAFATQLLEQAVGERTPTSRYHQPSPTAPTR